MSTALTINPDPELTLGERIRKSRTDAHLDQAALAARVGVSRPQVSKWERNLAVPDVYEAKAIAEITEQSFGWLCGVDARSRCFAPRPELAVIHGQDHAGEPTPPRVGRHLTIVRD